MVAPNEHLRELRDELDRAAQRISRFAIFSLFVLFLLFLTLSRAHRLVRNDETRDIAYRIASLSQVAGLEEPSLPPWIGFFNQDALAVPPLERTPTRKQVSVALKRLPALRDSLEQMEKSAGRQLQVEYSLFGMKLPLDLRELGLLLPLVFLVSSVYLTILLRKHEMLEALARARACEVDAAQVTDADFLRFRQGGAASPYFRHPVQLQKALYAACVAAFFMYVLDLARPARSLWSEGSLTEEMVLQVILPALQLLALLLFYAVAYARHVSSELRRQQRALMVRAARLPPPWKARRFLRPWRALLARVRPAFALPGGSVLSLMTLGMLVAATASSCTRESEPRTGLDLLAGRAGASWYTSTLRLGPGRDAAVDVLGQGVYAATLGLAVISLLLFATGAAGRAQVRRTWMEGLAAAAAFAGLFVVVDFGLSLGYFTPQLARVKVVFWAAPVFFWLRFRRRTQGGVAAWLRRSRAALLVVYAPLAVYAVVFLLVQWRTAVVGGVGLAVCFAGVLLLWRGFAGLARDAGRERAPAGAGTADAAPAVLAPAFAVAPPPEGGPRAP